MYETFFVIVQNNVLGEPVFSFSETGEVGPYCVQPDLSFGAGILPNILLLMISKYI